MAIYVNDVELPFHDVGIITFHKYTFHVNLPAGTTRGSVYVIYGGQRSANADFALE